jgi:hypothetical protein
MPKSWSDRPRRSYASAIEARVPCALNGPFGDVLRAIASFPPHISEFFEPIIIERSGAGDA